MPSAWLPRYEVMLLLSMGTRAAGAVLAGCAAARSIPDSKRFVTTRCAQMVSLAQLYRAVSDSAYLYRSHGARTSLMLRSRWTT